MTGTRMRSLSENLQALGEDSPHFIRGFEYAFIVVLIAYVGFSLEGESHNVVMFLRHLGLCMSFGILLYAGLALYSYGRMGRAVFSILLGLLANPFFPAALLYEPLMPVWIWFGYMVLHLNKTNYVILQVRQGVLYEPE